jgi:acetylornithine deacetylase/succinyl-diaminopimelate desuccinylase-like protein
VPARASDDLVAGEVVPLLQELLRVDTTSPPGNETAAALVLERYLASAGVETALLAREPERANLVARIRGRDPQAPRLLFLSHLDTVGADPSEWTVDPFGGELRDGAVWGRGALDMKNQAAAAAVALASLARAGFDPEGDIVFAACADEEIGESDVGLTWLCAEHREAVRAELCVNEGLGTRLVLGGETIYLYSVGEKESVPFRLRVRGRGGHGAQPQLADNPVVKAGVALARLGELRFPPRVGPEMQAFLAAARVAAVEELPPEVAVLFASKLGPTVAPTMVHASRARNVIPGACEIVCDCRLLPGGDRREVEDAVRRALGPELEYELTWLAGRGGSASTTDSPLADAIAESVRGLDPDARVAPVLMDGFTDSDHLRRAFGTVAYGFFPFPSMDAATRDSLIHGRDERIAVTDLVAGVHALVAIARRVQAPVSPALGARVPGS